MKSVAAFVVAASASLATAQITTNPNGTITCAIPNGVYCAGDSLDTNIIIRCDAAGVGHPGNCNDNLAGEVPVGVNYAPCWQPNATAGIAACSKNCIVYGGSGNYPGGDFTLPNCTPSVSTSSSSASSTSTSSSSSSGSTSTTTTTTTTGTGYSTSTTSSTSTSVSAVSSPSTSSASTTVSIPLNTGSSGGSGGSNGTIVTVTTTSVSATATPPTPTSSQPNSVSTAGASMALANGALVVAGLFAAVMV